MLPELRPRLRRRRSLSPPVALCVLPFVFSACGLGAAAATRGVQVQSIDTDVIFGAHAKTTASATPSAAATPGPAPHPPPTAAPGPTLALPPQATLALPSTTPFPTFAPAPVSCPTAPSTAFPAQVSDTEVTTTPAAGAYRWMTDGTASTTINGTAITLPVRGQRTRYVRHVSQPVPTSGLLPGSVPSNDFTFETVEPLLGISQAGFADLHWAVRTDSSTPKDPQGGLVLTQVDLLDNQGKQTSTFFKASAVGLLMMPLPVSSGGTWTGSAVDTSSGSTPTVTQLNGQVLARENIDACGQLIEAWHVHATMTVNSASTTLDYDVATQFGALIEKLTVDGPFVGGTLKSTARAGQVTPDALPEGFS